MSLDMKLFFSFFFGLMALFMLGSALSPVLELSVAGLGLPVLTCVSVANRIRRGWRWRGVGWKGVLGAVGAVAASGALMFAASPLASPWNPAVLPWYLCGTAIGLFNALTALRLVRPSISGFEADCSSASHQAATPPPDAQPRWKKAVQSIYGVVFFTIWLEFLAFFYLFGISFRDGAPHPTALKTEPLTNHGAVVFVTPDTKALIDLLQTVGMVGIPALVVTGFFLQFVLRVGVLPVKPRR
jgi:hypothetical protein